jgi:anti-sigma factor RsiW
MKNSSNGLCGISPAKVHAFTDHELQTEDWLAFKEHLSACPDCFAEHSQILAMKALFKRNLVHYRAPDVLRIKIALALQAYNGAAPVNTSGAKSSKPMLLSAAASAAKKGRPINRIAAALAASLVIALALNLALNGQALEDEIIASYQRSLDISLTPEGRPAAFRRERPRLAGSLDFVPPIPDLTGSGFTLEGARADQIARRGTAVLVYSRRSYVINLFIWRSGAEPFGALSKQGYNIVHWTGGGLKFCAISTLTASELAKFQELFASRLPA